jgi:putative pyruvate formate lyase activating enzyme
MMMKKEMQADLSLLENCSLCPRMCQANRLAGKLGYCNAGSGFEIASISVHKGEEPVISGENGICNVFFSHCNLQCIYCQNFQISSKECRIKTSQRSLEEIVYSIITILNEGVESLGFVSPSHMIPQMKSIILALHEQGYFPYIVYNTNAYDKVETLKALEEFVDVYLPDYKYSEPALAQKWSDAANYPEIAGLAIREMVRQKGNAIHLNEKGIAERGLLVRHLVLPGEVNNSIGVLRYLADEVSNRITLSLMSQYHPIPRVSNIISLNRKLKQEEYELVVEEMEKLGFSKGWVQDYDSADFYYPDFESENPFETR